MHGFSDEERDRIREQLIETGRELLLTYGPQKTTVQDITDPVGIAKPTFYRFFDAKADLYLVIFQRELEEYVEHVRSELTGIDDPQEGLERFFWCYVEFAEENPFIQQVFIQSQDNFNLRNISPSKLEEVQREGMAEILPFIEDLKAGSNGPLSDIDPFILLGLMGGSIGLLAFHKDEFVKYEDEFEGYGEGYYDRIQEVLILSLARGMTIGE
jgi:AcrR family transcriptional regulator